YIHDQLGVPLDPERINELVVAALLDQYGRRLPLLPGAIAAIRRLAGGWPLGLASSANRPVIDTVLKQAGIINCFAVTVSGEEVAVGKPAPDVYISPSRAGWVSIPPTLQPWRTRRAVCRRPPQ